MTILLLSFFVVIFYSTVNVFFYELVILGAGNIGALIATSLASIPVSPPAVTLVLRNLSRVHNYESHNSTLVLTRPTTVLECSIPAVAQLPLTRPGGPPDAIQNLIVTTKAGATISAVGSVMPSISRNTNILLLQNGAGGYEALCKTYWPDASTRPNILVGVTTHGVKPDGDWRFRHAGIGDIKISAVPDRVREHGDLTGAEELVQCLQHADQLNVQVVDYAPDFLIKQYEKLVVNAVLNPLTAIYECFNGELAALSSISIFTRYITSEASRVLLEHVRRKFPDVYEKYTTELGFGLSVDRLSSSVSAVMLKTAQNKSSMFQDTSMLRETEIDFINGYIVDLGKEYNIPTPYNRMMVEMVRSRLSLNIDRDKRTLPVIDASIAI